MSFEDPSRRALVAGIALRLAAAAALLLLGADGFQIAVLGAQGLNPDEITFDELVRFGVFTVYLLVLIVTVVAFARWEHRAARNARRLDASCAYAPGWAVGWWFIPLANLVVPYRVLCELWRASGRDASTGPPYLGAWWGCLVGSLLLGNLAGRVSGEASSVAVAQLADVIDICSNGLAVVGALLALRLVRDLTRRQLDAAGQRLATSSSSESTSLGPGRLK